MPHWINNTRIEGDGTPFSSVDPSLGEPVWTGRAATSREVDAAISAARTALSNWSGTPLPHRTHHLQSFAAVLQNREPSLATMISRETGKPLWESKEEVAAMIAKVPLSIQAYEERRRETSNESNGVTAAIHFKPHGVMAVLGPFNFPGHLPNGHIVPALLAGNTVVFKPSEMTPGVAELTVEAWFAAGLPPGVLNVVQGGRETGEAIVAHHGVDGILFTGSVGAGLALHRALAGRPQTILALEMGGNNPLIVANVANTDSAADTTIRSAFATAGQRCTCARRLIVPVGPAGDQFVETLARKMGEIRVGRYDQHPPPFMGPVISDLAAERLLAVQEDLRYRGGRVIVPMTSLGPRTMLSPGLMDVTNVPEMEDVEHFGPFLQLTRVENFDAAIREANRTAFGLAAGLLSDRREDYDRFAAEIRAGVVNWNRPTTGASGRLPFGGVGLSGNHRPSGYYAADYCSYPVAVSRAARP